MYAFLNVCIHVHTHIFNLTPAIIATISCVMSTLVTSKRYGQHWFEQNGENPCQVEYWMKADENLPREKGNSTIWATSASTIRFMAIFYCGIESFKALFQCIARKMIYSPLLLLSSNVFAISTQQTGHREIHNYLHCTHSTFITGSICYYAELLWFGATIQRAASQHWNHQVWRQNGIILFQR